LKIGRVIDRHLVLSIVVPLVVEFVVVESRVEQV
jgi:hypothetical protein